ncbi:hypothetical protein PR048_003356 [Dryococelus australis]|uniref:Uncharacterized protein n=1 Tax=Dryococelus australis TaxID=614101 RepID=A0ABQ9INS9_9NEOP|nr:hypothetical protein PR048_003356 [Dryococelus australis]
MPHYASHRKCCWKCTLAVSLFQIQMIFPRNCLLNACIWGHRNIFFFQYANIIFHPWLVEENISLPVLLFIHGHSSHLTVLAGKFYAGRGIMSLALLPYSTRILQLINVGVFQSLKIGGRKCMSGRNCIIVKQLVMGGMETQRMVGHKIPSALQKTDFQQRFGHQLPLNIKLLWWEQKLFTTGSVKDKARNDQPSTSRK